MSEPVTIVISTEGGLITGVVSAGVRVEYVVINYDVEGAPEEDIIQVPQGNGKTEDATYMGDMAEIDGPWVLQVYETVKAFNEGSRDDNA